MIRKAYRAPEDIWCAGFVITGKAAYADNRLRQYREHIASDDPSMLKDSNMDAELTQFQWESEG